MWLRAAVTRCLLVEQDEYAAGIVTRLSRGLIGREQAGHEGQQVRSRLPGKLCRFAHGLDESDCAICGQDVVVAAAVAGGRNPARPPPLRIQVPEPGHVEEAPVRALAEDPARPDRGSVTYR